MTSIPASVTSANTYTDPRDRADTLWDHASWGPIMMGAVCAIGLQFIFTVLGIALGASAGEVTTGIDGSSVRTMGIVAGLWWLITGTLSLAAGGFIFGRLSGLPRSVPLALKAVTLWGVVALFGFLVVWSGAGMLSQAASPIAAISSASLDPYASQNARPDATRTGGATSAGTTSESSARVAGAAEEARRATRTASWWSVIGLLMGLCVTVGAAAAAVPTVRRDSSDRSW